MDLEKLLKEHIDKEDNLMKLHHRVLFGDQELDEMGLIKQNKEIYDILTSVKNVNKFIGGFGATLKWLLIIGAVIGLIKGWFAGIVAYIAHQIK